MFCEKCGTKLPDDARFCQVCGTQLAPMPAAQPLFCENCGFSLEPGSTFCPNCGKPVASAAIPPAPARKAKRPLLLGGIAAALAVIIAVCILCFAGSSMPNYVIYGQDDRYFAMESPDGEPVRLGKDLTDTPFITNNGKALFFLDDSGDLIMLTLSSGEKTQLAKSVDSFKINDRGNRVFYKKNGDLYFHDLTDSQKIVTDVLAYHISADGKTLVYTAEKSDGQILFRKTGDEAPVEIARHETIDIEHFSKDLCTVLYASNKSVVKQGDLYIQTDDQPATLISEGASSVSPIYDGNCFYYAVYELALDDFLSGSLDDGLLSKCILYYYDGKTGTEVCKGFAAAESTAKDAPGIVFMYYPDGHFSPIPGAAVGDSMVPVEEEECSAMVLSPDARKLLYITEYENNTNALNLMDTSDGSVQAVHSGELCLVPYFINDQDFVYSTRDGMGNTALYRNGVLISEDDASFLLYHEELGMLFCCDQDSYRVTLYLYTDDGAITRIDDDVLLYALTVTYGGDLLYVTDEDREDEGPLYYYDGSKSVKIADECIGVATVPTVTEAY